MGGGGGSSTTQNTTNQIDNRRVLGQGAISAENSTITLTDAGAVAGALSLAGQALNLNAKMASGTAASALDSLNSTTSAVQQAYASARGQGNMVEYVTIGAMALVAIIAYAALQKK